MLRSIYCHHYQPSAQVSCKHTTIGSGSKVTTTRWSILLGQSKIYLEDRYLNQISRNMKLQAQNQTKKNCQGCVQVIFTVADSR